MSKKVYISDKQCGIIRENEWNFHIGKNHNLEPYYSDNKRQMGGRETGHFGSGTYFSTYRDKNDIDNYGILNKNQNPNFIEIGEHIYRVDFDLYKNMYRVRNKKQGDILYTMMRNLNAMYNMIAYQGYYSPKMANYNNAKFYQIIKSNAEALGLNCPSYYELTRMAQRHEGMQSFSTVFMEWNGYNGVNVSGVEYYDNTKHGSVIYDLSKTNTEMEEVRPNSLFTGFKDTSYDDTVAMKGYDDEVINSLRGEYLTWADKLNDMPLTRALRLLKNYTDSGHVLNYYTLSGLKPELIKRYLRMVYVKNPNGYWYDPVFDEFFKGHNSRIYAKLIDEYGAYYWLNYVPRSKTYESLLVNLLNNFARNIPWNIDIKQERKMKEDYLNKLMSYMERDLTKYEEEYIKEDYLDYDNGQENQ